jgi:hypothetical protein
MAMQRPQRFHQLTGRELMDAEGQKTDDECDHYDSYD